MTGEERFRLLMESVKDFAIFMLDPEGRIVDWNSGAQHILGYAENEIIGQPFSIIFPQEDRQNGVPEKELRTATEMGRASDDRWHVRKDGTHFFANGTTTPLRNEEGSLRGFAKVLRDYTERKEWEERLRERDQALMQADRRKDEFLAVLAHELRNPLAPIFNSLTLLANDHLPTPEQKQARTIIDRQVRQLARLIDDLLDVSRITKDKVQLRRKPIEVHALIDSAVQTSRPFIESHGEKLSVSLPSQPIWVDGDPARLEQVLTNLLNNAAKYSGEGSHISLWAEKKGSEAVIGVRDTGVGIAPDLLPRLFDLFVQGDQGLDHAKGGLGIGLTLVKRLVELHGGKVEARSEGLDKGSEFVVHLPLTTPPASNSMELRTEAAGQKERSFKMLVVDDNIDAAESLCMLLRTMGHDVESAHSGPEALQKTTSYKPQIVLLDIGLPGLDGYQVASRLRQEYEMKDVVLIAVSGYGQEADRQRSKEVGFNCHMVKPVDFEELQAWLKTLTDKCGIL